MWKLLKQHEKPIVESQHQEWLIVPLGKARLKKSLAGKVKFDLDQESWVSKEGKHIIGWRGKDEQRCGAVQVAGKRVCRDWIRQRMASNEAEKTYYLQSLF